MYFFVRYIDREIFEKQRDLACSVNIPFGEYNVLIVNPDCFIGIIMDYIYKEAGIEGKIKEYFDLFTDERKPLEINRYEPDVSGSIIFGHKMTYYLVYLQEKEMKAVLRASLKDSEDLCLLNTKRSTPSVSIRASRSRSRS